MVGIDGHMNCFALFRVEYGDLLNEYTSLAFSLPHSLLTLNKTTNEQVYMDVFHPRCSKI